MLVVVEEVAVLVVVATESMAPRRIYTHTEPDRRTVIYCALHNKLGVDIGAAGKAGPDAEARIWFIFFATLVLLLLLYFSHDFIYFVYVSYIATSLSPSSCILTLLFLLLFLCYSAFFFTFVSVSHFLFYSCILIATFFFISRFL